MKANIPQGSFSVHLYKPEDFLVVFSSEEHRRSVADRPFIEHNGFKLYFRQWTRQAQAKQVAMRTRVQLAVEGIPPHAWEADTVQSILGTSGSVEAVAQETADRTDLGTFRLDAWTADPDSIPPLSLLWVPEPTAGVPFPPPVSRSKELGLLQYRVLTHIERVEEFCPLDDPSFRVRGSPDSDRDGMPEDDDFMQDGEGFWTSTDRSWETAVPDSRGPFASRDGHGNGGDHRRQCRSSAVPRRRNAGPLDWQLPCMNGRIARRRSRGGQKVPVPLTPLPSLETPAPKQLDDSVLITAADPNVATAAGPVDQAEAGTNAVPTHLGPALSTLDQGAKLELTPSLTERMAVSLETAGEPAQEMLSVTTNEETASSTASVPRDPLERALDSDSCAGYIQISLSEISSGNDPNPEAELSTGQAQQAQELATSGHCANVVMQPSTDVEVIHAAETSSQDFAALGRMRSFCARILKALAPPLLREIEAANAKRVQAQLVTPRRSNRLTTQATPVTAVKPKKASTAETALLKALGMSPVDLAVEESALQDFRHLFDSPLQEQHTRALAAVFGKTMPPRDEIVLSGGGMISAL